MNFITEVKPFHIAQISFLENAELKEVLKQLAQAGLNVLAAIALFIIGRWLINFALSLMSRTLKGRNIDLTLIAYTKSTLRVVLTIILIVGILGRLGIETASFAALLAGAGVAIGAAWSGLLANLAAGVFLIFFRPFKVGDSICAAGVTGTVQEIGLFVTSINTIDNIVTYVGNNKLFSDNIQNFSQNDYRRVDLVAQLSHDTDHQAAIEMLKQELRSIPNVVTRPTPDVEILEFNLAGTVLAVRPYCNNKDYWQVYFDTNKLIRETFGKANFSVPGKRYIFENHPNGLESQSA
jgi:small conductance mechanosensitive channel